jgi:type II secretory pathway component PulK
MNNKGVILIITLWVVLFLSLIAWGLGRRSSMEVSLIKTYRGKLRSYAAARAGLNYCLDLLQRTPAAKDTLYATGINIDQTKSPQDIFAHIDTGQNAYAIVEWPAQNFNTANVQTNLEYGIRDEEGRININAINTSNYQILSALLQLYDLSLSEADKLALAIVNFSGINAQASNNNAFLDLDASLLKPKIRPYENLLELLEVRGMTREIFGKLKNDVTVYGDKNGLWINTDTANNNVIRAAAIAAARGNPSANAANIIAQAYAIRDGADGNSFTPDDGAGSLAGNTVAFWPAVLQEGVSNYYRVRIIGIDGDSATRTVIEAVVHRLPGLPGQIISWQRD